MVRAASSGQIARHRNRYAQLGQQPTDVAKYMYLDALHDRNETLYFKLLAEHLPELLPVVYDPTVGDAIELWSHDSSQSTRSELR